ncbi:MAG: hypothetical protein K6E52_07930 [Bacteroidaceae bacterium]|nr:hypothetical protein [Bacteroidaceae bacterium]
MGRFSNPLGIEYRRAAAMKEEVVTTVNHSTVVNENKESQKALLIIYIEVKGPEDLSHVSN